MEKFERIKYLVNYLNEMTEKYDAGTPEISDRQWDSLYFELKNLEDETGIVFCDSPTQNVHYSVVNSLTKVQHNHSMLSLAKTKDWNEFLNYFKDKDKDVVGMVKLDGLTCSLEYEDGKLIHAETRGNGVIGEDIFHNALVIPSIPKLIPYYEHLIVDGEIICTDKDFEEFSADFSNSRNFASGSIRLLDSKECEKRKLTFVVWNIVDGFNSENSFISKLEKLNTLGFKVVPWTSSFDLDSKDFLIDKAKELGYPIDGLVGRFEDISYGQSLGETAHHSKAAFAFKFFDETYPTHLINIEWTMGRTGVLTPVAVFEPIEIDNAIIERASLHNISIMEQLNEGIAHKGDILYIYRANMIIPQVEEWESNDDGKLLLTPNKCPICGHEVEVQISDSGTKNLVCKNPDCDGKFINKLDHFCGKKGLDIKGLSKATLEKLISWGWVNNLSDIFTLSQYRKEWIIKPGFGQKSVDKILESIEKSKDTNLESFISSLGIPLIGKTVAKELVKHITTYSELREKIQSNFDFSCYEGFADSKTSALLHFNYDEADKIYQYLNCSEKIVEEEEMKSNDALNGLTFVITGKLNNFNNRAELQSKIESLGGKVTGSISKNTNYLINNDKTSTSTKNLAAQKFGTKIISENEFIEKFLLT